jgi:hypothetical protein
MPCGDDAKSGPLRGRGCDLQAVLENSNGLPYNVKADAVAMGRAVAHASEHIDNSRHVVAGNSTAGVVDFDTNSVTVTPAADENPTSSVCILHRVTYKISQWRVKEQHIAPNAILRQNHAKFDSFFQRVALVLIGNFLKHVRKLDRRTRTRQHLHLRDRFLHFVCRNSGRHFVAAKPVRERTLSMACPCSRTTSAATEATISAWAVSFAST